jgi:hypothetical protein
LREDEEGREAFGLVDLELETGDEGLMTYDWRLMTGELGN